MPCCHLPSAADLEALLQPPGTGAGSSDLVAATAGGKHVTGLENPRASIICVQQGERRQRDKNRVPIPRQVVTHGIGKLSIADIAVQHKTGNRWQWHRQKSNGSATDRTEVGEAQRPL